LYTEGKDQHIHSGNNSLLVYSVGDLTSPSAIYELDDYYINSALVTDNRLYLGGFHYFHIFELSPSLIEPLTRLFRIDSYSIKKILRVGDELLLGKDCGSLKFFDLKTSKITSTL
jgi:hypothetical protein